MKTLLLIITTLLIAGSYILHQADQCKIEILRDSLSVAQSENIGLKTLMLNSSNDISTANDIVRCFNNDSLDSLAKVIRREYR